MGNMDQKYRPVEVHENEAEIKAICENSQVLLLERFGVELTNPKAVATIAYAFFYSAAQYVNDRKSAGADYSLNIMELFDLGASFAESEDAEKEGSFVPFLTPGKEMKLLIKDDSETEAE